MITFQNSKNIINLMYAKKKYSSIINKDNLLGLSKFKIKKIFKQEDPKVVKQYSRFILNEFIKENYKSDTAFLRKVRRNIKKLSIELTDMDKQNIRILRERVFSVDRHIKVLSSTSELQKGENVGIKFMDAQLFIKEAKLKLLLKGEMLITNQRIIFPNSEDITFNWNTIKKQEFHDYGFEFKHSKKTYVIRIHDNETFKNTLKNFEVKIIK